MSERERVREKSERKNIEREIGWGVEKKRKGERKGKRESKRERERERKR